MAKKRLRLIVGPNGSGKSSLKTSLDELDLNNFSFTNYLNADDILKKILDVGYYNLSSFESFESLIDFSLKSSYPQEVKDCFLNASIREEKGRLFFTETALNAYVISLLVAYKCDIFMKNNQSFSFESVFSSSEKINLIKKAKKLGYRVYLYCISTENPKINKGRVEVRVKDGGHNVPAEKIKSRFPKSLRNISKSLGYVDRAYFWDNTTENTEFLASFDAEDYSIEISKHNDLLPKWFKKFILKI